MGRGPHSPGYPVNLSLSLRCPRRPEFTATETLEELQLIGLVGAVTSRNVNRKLAGQRAGGAVVPFLVGVATGGVAGAIIGTLVGTEVVQIVTGAADRIERKLTKAERDELRFELMLQ